MALHEVEQLLFGVDVVVARQLFVGTQRNDRSNNRRFNFELIRVLRWSGRWNDFRLDVHLTTEFLVFASFTYFLAEKELLVLLKQQPIEVVDVFD